MIKKLFNIFSKAIPTIIGMFLGFFVGKTIGSYIERFDSMASFILIGFISLILAFIFQILLHELGHLFFGSLTGYSFVSFRLGNFILVKDAEGLSLRRYVLPGTLGQCLLAPPELGKDYNFPFVLYNLGGGIFNLFFSFFGILLLGTRQFSPGLEMFLSIFISLGIFLALTNLIPLKSGDLGNDGYNIIELMKNKYGRYGFWLQLYINREISRGKRLGQVERKLFKLPKDLDFNDIFSSSIVLMEAEYYMDLGQLKKAEDIYLRIERENYKLVGVHENQLRLGLGKIYLEREDRLGLEKLMADDFKKYLKATEKYMLDTIGFLYGYELLFEKDSEAARVYENRLRKMETTYPYRGLIEAELQKARTFKELSEQNQILAN